MPSDTTKFRFIQAVVLGSCLVLLAMNVLLNRANRRLTARITYLEQSNGPQIGSVFPSIFGTDFKNENVVVDYSAQSRPSLLLVFSPYCPFSKTNWPNWKKLIADSPGVPVVFADLSGKVSQGFFDSMDTSPPASLIRVPDILKVEHKLDFTPTTIVIGAGGVVAQTVLGVMNEDQLKSVEKTLNSGVVREVGQKGE